MKQRIAKSKNSISGFTNLDIYNSDHQISWNNYKSGFSHLSVVQTHALDTVSITAIESYQDKKPQTREVRFEIDLEGAKALRDHLDEIIEREGA